MQVLFVITDRKAKGQLRHQMRDKRDVRRAVHATSAEGGADPLGADASPGPSPEFAAEIADECARLLAQLNDGQLRQLAIGKMEGFTNEEIARKIGRSVPTVERKLTAIRVIWDGEG